MNQNFNLTGQSLDVAISQQNYSTYIIEITSIVVLVVILWAIFGVYNA